MIFSVQPHRLIITESITTTLITEVHQHFSHVGGYKIYHALKQHYFFNNIYKKIKQIIKTRETCQKTKIYNYLSRGPIKSLQTQRPLDLVSVDLMGFNAS